MKTNSAGIALIKDFEKLALTSYRDPVGIWTVGYGSTGPDVREGMSVTKQWAEDRFLDDLAHFEREVSKRIRSGNRCQFSAMVSLCFNIGAGNFAKSTLLKHHNAGNFAKAAEQFLVWNKATGKDGVKCELKGLTRRRAAEAALYLTPTAADEVADPQRTRASDVEPSPVTPPPASNAGIATAGAVGTAAVIGQQAVAQASGVWSWLTEAGLDPQVVLAAFAIALVAIGGWALWRLYQARRVVG